MSATEKKDKGPISGSDPVSVSEDEDDAFLTASVSSAATERVARQQFDTALKLVGTIKDIGYTKFRNQVKRVAYTNDWHPSFLDAAAEVSEAAAATVKFKCDQKNAYNLLMTKSEGHEVDFFFSRKQIY